MSDSTPISASDPTRSTTLTAPPTQHTQLQASIDTASTADLARVLAERLAITPGDWHRLKSNRKARASEQAAMALVYLLNDQPEEALLRLHQATGWLDRSISAPPCPTHGNSH